MKIVAAVRRLLRKASRMANCGGKRANGETLRSLPVTKRARKIPTPGSGSQDWVFLTRENEDLRRQLKSAQDISNELQKDKDCALTVTDEKTSGLDLSDSAKENDKRILERELDSCQSELKERDLKIVTLETSAIVAEQAKLELETRITKIQQQLCKELEGCGSYADGAATPFLLESTLNAVQNTASTFTKVFLEYSKRHSVDVNCALTQQFQNPYLTRLGHATYMLKAWIFKILFEDFENETFSCGGTSIFLDQTERRLRSFEYFQLLESTSSVVDLGHSFEHFRYQKYRDFLSLWQSSDQVTAGSLLSDALEDTGAEESKVRLMESFRSVAKGVWALHKLSLSFQTRAEIFRVSQQTEFSAEYMDSVVSMHDDERFVSNVGFMICPGFRLKKSVLKCQIYLAGGSK